MKQQLSLSIKMFTAYFYQVFQFLIFIWTTSHIFLQRTKAQQTSEMYVPSSDSSYFFYQQSAYPRDCKDVYDQCSTSNSSGVFYIKPDGYEEPFQIYCINAAESVGWTVIQRRVINGAVSFNRDWGSYKSGFGFLSREFWIGNERLSYLTNQRNYELMIEFTLTDHSAVSVSYNNFRIGDEFSEYRLFSSLLQTSDTAGITWCPDNMVYGNCTCGQRSCGNPSSCDSTCIGDQPESCICPEGFYEEGGVCLRKQECGCYIAEEQAILTEGGTYVNSDCTRLDTCFSGHLTSNNSYECSSHAVCEERNGERKCYCNEGFTGDGVNCTYSVRTDCMDVYNAGFNTSGVYSIKPTGWTRPAFNVYCNMTDGGGWTVFQRRMDGSVDFYLGWSSYQEGFGNVDHEHWLGNDKLYYLTNQKRYQLRIDLVNRDGNPYFSKFDYFKINNEADNYRLSEVGAYSGNADTNNGYSLTVHRGQQFSTKDRDHDSFISYHCAQGRGGAWWYNACGNSNLNGRYSDLFVMNYIPGSDYLNFSEMKLRPI